MVWILSIYLGVWSGYWTVMTKVGRALALLLEWYEAALGGLADFKFRLWTGRCSWNWQAHMSGKVVNLKRKTDSWTLAAPRPTASCNHRSSVFNRLFHVIWNVHMRPLPAFSNLVSSFRKVEIWYAQSELTYGCRIQSNWDIEWKPFHFGLCNLQQFCGFGR